jgi:hypothetical protein
VQPIAAQAADLFYGRLFEIARNLRPLFPRGYDGAEAQADGHAPVANLHQVEKIMPAVQDLRRRHSAAASRTHTMRRSARR